MAKDICIMDNRPTGLAFAPVGKVSDGAQAILQRLIVLLFAVNSGGYRKAENGIDLLSYVEGSNMPPAGVLLSTVVICCKNALSALDDEDRQLVDDFYCDMKDDDIVCTLRMKTGETVQGVL